MGLRERPLSIAPLPFGVHMKNTADIMSPADHIDEEGIHVLDDKTIIDVPGLMLSRYADTKSMDPFFDKYANGLELSPKTSQEVHAGDIISFQTERTMGLLVHRIVDTGFDDERWFAVTKRDNNRAEDS